MFSAEVDPSNLAETGWGLVLAAGTSPAIVDALEPLLAVRREQAGDRFRVLEVRPGEDAMAFLSRYDARLGFPDSADVPGYLLLVGDPTLIPFEFQTVLGISHAVGRLAFDTIDEYGRYAVAAAAHDAASARAAGDVVLFSPGAANEPALEGADTLVLEPLLGPIAKRTPERQARFITGADATRNRLVDALAVMPAVEPGAATLDLLVTVTQSVVFPPDHARQRDQQGSLLCAPSGSANTSNTGLAADRVFSAADVPEHADLRGLIAVHVGSFCAGTGRLDSVAVQTFKEQLLLAPEPFIGRLPQRLLGHARPALAVIGQMDRLTLRGPVDQRWAKLTTFLRDLLLRLLRDYRVGHALTSGAAGWAAAAADLARALNDASIGAPADDVAIASAWAQKEVLRSFILLGDPAVRLRNPTA